jgi:hypothetical protein
VEKRNNTANIWLDALTPRSNFNGKMGIIEELKSGKAGLYAQWGGIISAVLLILFGAIFFLGNIIFAIIGFIFAAFILLIEIPLCLKCCPFSEGFDNAMKTFEKPQWRFLAYLMYV